MRLPTVKNVAFAPCSASTSSTWPVWSPQGPSSNVSAITLSSPTSGDTLRRTMLLGSCLTCSAVMPDVLPVFVAFTPSLPSPSTRWMAPLPSCATVQGMAVSTESDGSSIGPPSPISTTSPDPSFVSSSVTFSPFTVAWNGSPLPASSTLPSTASRSPGWGLTPLADRASPSVLPPCTSTLAPFSVMLAGRLCTNSTTPMMTAATKPTPASTLASRRPGRSGFCAMRI